MWRENGQHRRKKKITNIFSNKVGKMTEIREIIWTTVVDSDTDITKFQYQYIGRYRNDFFQLSLKYGY